MHHRLPKEQALSPQAAAETGVRIEQRGRRRPVSIAKLRMLQAEPNLTAILPGECQARCPFCIEPWSANQAQVRTWLDSFQRLVVGELPEVFRVLSISGGEPSLSPVFADLLRWLAEAKESRRLRRVVLTTNGFTTAMESHLELLGPALTHVNISRHAEEDVFNAKVFKTDRVPVGETLRELISKLNRKGLVVNVNCVYSRKHAFGRPISGVDLSQLRARAKSFITWAKGLGATSVVFRHDHRDSELDRETALEAAFSDYASMHVAQCESCRVVGKLIRGMPVTFKRALYEPVRAHMPSELYEMVFHSDGGLYRDWGRLQPIRRPLPRMVAAESLKCLYEDRQEIPMIPLMECEAPRVPCNVWMPIDDLA